MLIAKQLAKAGFYHCEDEDFTDDGVIVSVWEKDGVIIFYSRKEDQVFLSIRPDYFEVPYKVYRLFPSYKLTAQYNGVHESKVDVKAFIENVKFVAQDLADYRAGRFTARRDAWQT